MTFAICYLVLMIILQVVNKFLDEALEWNFYDDPEEDSMFVIYIIGFLLGPITLMVFLTGLLQRKTQCFTKAGDFISTTWNNAVSAAKEKIGK